MAQSILVVADEQDNLSIEKAHSIASSLDVKLEVVSFLSDLDTVDELQRKQAIETAKQTLDQATSNIFGEHAQVTCNVIVTNDVVDWIMNACKQKKFDFVVKTGHRTESLFHTPMDWHLMRKLPCPILLASNRKWKSKQVIVAAVDLSKEDKQTTDYNNIVLKWAVLLSDVFNCEAHIVYSIPIAKPLLEFDVVDKSEVKKRKQPEAEKRLSSLMTNSDLGDAHTHITAGPPDKTIPHLANELKADLVIMGCVGRKGLKGFLFGNAAENTLHNLRTDILICRSRRAKIRT
ncbi:universal stress protein [Oceanicoccus sp. KOV_DT_Chl]|uniref:universal stress protein n=1 Tax=Oceanicoccus sp. KOV_DT_Chl TaxID=1904639 RepID=UPI000C7CEEF4|nr:universal stress protein [Oceanicoccus sp. KOV_DT_Chl]